MPYDEFAEIRDINYKLLKANNPMSILPSLNDFIDKTPSCPKCGAGETFRNREDRCECAICQHNWH